MHIPTHILSGWCLANALPLSPRERLMCMVAAAAPDLDGLGIFFGEEAYWRFHHVLGHNVFFGIAVAATLAVTSQRRRLAFAAYAGLFHLHLLMDYYGSGPGWQIYYLWPADQRGWRSAFVWALNDWRNYFAFVALLAITAWIARHLRRTPLELIAPRFDALLIGFAGKQLPTSDHDLQNQETR